MPRKTSNDNEESKPKKISKKTEEIIDSVKDTSHDGIDEKDEDNKKKISKVKKISKAKKIVDIIDESEKTNEIVDEPVKKIRKTKKIVDIIDESEKTNEIADEPVKKISKAKKTIDIDDEPVKKISKAKKTIDIDDEPVKKISKAKKTSTIIEDSDTVTKKPDKVPKLNLSDNIIDISNEIIIDSPTKKSNIESTINNSKEVLTNNELTENCNNSDYNIKFNELKINYINVCKDISTIQLQLNNKDKEREQILKNIRKIQIECLPQTSFGVMVNSDLITDSRSNKTANIISNKSITIKKPKRQTDMETDDSNSDCSDNLQESDYDSD